MVILILGKLYSYMIYFDSSFSPIPYLFNPSSPPYLQNFRFLLLTPCHWKDLKKNILIQSVSSETVMGQSGFVCAHVPSWFIQKPRLDFFLLRQNSHVPWDYGRSYLDLLKSNLWLAVTAPTQIYDLLHLLVWSIRLGTLISASLDF